MVRMLTVKIDLKPDALIMKWKSQMWAPYQYDLCRRNLSNMQNSDVIQDTILHD